MSARRRSPSRAAAGAREPEVVLDLGFEGGGFTVYRVPVGDGFEYFRDVNTIFLQSLMADLDGGPLPAPDKPMAVDETGGVSARGARTTLREVVVELLKEGFFLSLYPLVVHRDVVPLLKALARVEEALDEDRYRAPLWDEVFRAGSWPRADVADGGG